MGAAEGPTVSEVCNLCATIWPDEDERGRAELERLAVAPDAECYTGMPNGDVRPNGFGQRSARFGVPDLRVTL